MESREKTMTEIEILDTTIETQLVETPLLNQGVKNNKCSKKEFFCQHKILIGCITFGILIITVLATLVIPKILEKTILNKPSTKYINTIKDNEKILPKLQLESGSKLPTYNMFFTEPNNIQTTFEIKYYLKNKELSLDDISEIENGIRYLKGTQTYQVELKSDTETLTTFLEVIDTQKPAVVLKAITVKYGEEYNPKDFVNQYDDNSREYTFTVNLKNKEQKKIQKSGHHFVYIEVCDLSNNCVDQRATIIVGSKSETLLFTKEERIAIKTEKLNYGLEKTTYVNVTYNIYQDGSKEEVKRSKEEIFINQENFNGTALTMKKEMQENFSNYSISRLTILNKTNEYRISSNISKLELDENLSKVAMLRAMEIAYSGKLEHTRPNGQDWTTMWEEYNEKETDMVLAENIAEDYKTDYEVVDEWYNSPKHKAIMLESRFTKIGIGKYSFNGKTYWVQHFAE